MTGWTLLSSPVGIRLALGYWQVASQDGVSMRSASMMPATGVRVPSSKPGIAGPSSTLPASVDAPTTAGQVRCSSPSGVYSGRTVTFSMST